jgi:hypothetical protein
VGVESVIGIRGVDSGAGVGTGIEVDFAGGAVGSGAALSAGADIGGVVMEFDEGAGIGSGC